MNKKIKFAHCPIELCKCGRKYIKSRIKGQETCLFCLKQEDPLRYEKEYPGKIIPTSLLPTQPQTEQHIQTDKTVVGVESKEEEGGRDYHVRGYSYQKN